jgi:hypothetical protein
MGKRASGLLVVAVLIAAGAWVWLRWAPTPERAIQQRLRAFATELNSSTTDGLGSVARAARVGQYFTREVVIEFGGGSPPIHGRETLIGMAARLQPRTAAFVVELNDITVQMVDDTRADVALTAVIRRRDISSGEESLDAREFSADVRQVEGEWRMNRVTAVETLKK